MFLSDEQMHKVLCAIGDGTDFPKITNDPQVNWKVDCETLGEYIPYDAELYNREIEAWRNIGAQLM